MNGKIPYKMYGGHDDFDVDHRTKYTVVMKGDNTNERKNFEHGKEIFYSG